MKRIKILSLLFFTLLVQLNIAQVYSLKPGDVRSDEWSEPKGGYKFDGVDDYVSVPDNDNLTLPDDAFTIHVLLKVNTIKSSEILGKSDGSTAREYEIWLSSTGELKFLLYDSGGSTNYSEFKGLTISQDKIYDIWFVWDGTDGQIYSNGVPITTTKTDTWTGFSSFTNTSQSLEIGRRGDGSWYSDMEFYEAHFFNLALTASEVTQLYNNGQPHLTTIPFELRGASQTDWVTNGDVESGLPTVLGASIFNTRCTSTQSSALAHSGTYSVKVTSDGTLSNNFYTRYHVNTSSYNGKKIHQEIWVYLPSGQSGFTQLDLVVKNEGVEKTLASTTTTDTWVKLEGDITLGTRVVGDFMLAVRTNSIADPTGFYFYWDDASAKTVGNVAEYRPENMGTNGIIDVSGNHLNGNTYGDPIAMGYEQDGRVGVGTTEVELVNTHKNNTLLKGIIVIEKSGSSNTVYIGSATGSYDIANGVTINANESLWISVGEYALADRSLYVKAGAASLDFQLVYEER